MCGRARFTDFIFRHLKFDKLTLDCICCRAEKIKWTEAYSGGGGSGRVTSNLCPFHSYIPMTPLFLRVKVTRKENSVNPFHHHLNIFIAFAFRPNITFFKPFSFPFTAFSFCNRSLIASCHDKERGHNLGTLLSPPPPHFFLSSVPPTAK